MSEHLREDDETVHGLREQYSEAHERLTEDRAPVSGRETPVVAPDALAQSREARAKLRELGDESV